MKLLGLIVVAVCLGTSSAGFFSKVTSAVSSASDAVTRTTTNALNAQVEFAKSSMTKATDAAKSTTNMAMNTAKSTTNMAMSTAGSAVKAMSEGTINTGIRFFLDRTRDMVKVTGKRNIGIPDTTTNMGPIVFNATNGFFRDISSLSQAGKANVSMNGTSILIDIPVKLNSIDTGYENFTVSMWKLKAGGGINVHVANDTFVIHLRLKPGITCALNVEKVDVTEFGGISVDFTNMGSKSEWVLEKCGNMMIKFMKENIKKQVQSSIDTTLKEMLKENGSICSKFLG